MINKEFISNYLIFKNLPFIEMGEVIPIDVIELLQKLDENDSKVVDRFKHLLRPNNEKKSIPIELRCSQCGEVFTMKSSLSKLRSDIRNHNQIVSFNHTYVSTDKPMMCPECTQKYVDQLIAEEEKSIQAKLLKEKEEKIRQQKLIDERIQIINSFLEIADDDFTSSVGIGDYLRLKETYSNMTRAENANFVKAIIQLSDNKQLFDTKYWKTITKERLRCEKNPTCALTNKNDKDELVAFPAHEYTLGLELKPTILNGYVFVDKKLVSQYGTKAIMELVDQSTTGPKTSKDNMRYYRLDETLEFGKFAGNTIRQIIKSNSGYLLYLNKKDSRFNVIDEDGQLLF